MGQDFVEGVKIHKENVIVGLRTMVKDIIS